MFRFRHAWILLALTTLLVLATPANAQQAQWTKSAGNPILSPSSWDPGGLIRPRVLYDGTTFRMWYSGMDVKGNLVGIGYATSTNGSTWVANSQPVLQANPGSWEGNYISIGSVLWNGSIFTMYYRGVGGQAGSAEANGAVGIATSSDGVTWTRYAGNPVMRASSSVDSQFLSTPYVIQTGSTYQMWYTCRNPLLTHDAICHATSTDGKSWSKDSLPILTSGSGWDSGDVYSPSVIFDGTTYGMWYSSMNQTGLGPRIGFASSKDGVTWTKNVNNPILSWGPATWDDGGVENQCVIQYNNGYILYYDGDGMSQTSLSYIGMAQAAASFSLELNPSIAVATAPLVDSQQT